MTRKLQQSFRNQAAWHEMFWLRENTDAEKRRKYQAENTYKCRREREN